LRYRENIPLAVMSVVSLAVLLVFGFSETTLRATPRQLNGCGGSYETVVAPLSPRFGTSKGRWHAFPPAPPTPAVEAVGCVGSGMTYIGGGAGFMPLGQPDG
jgi:hypothetical protein